MKTISRFCLLLAFVYTMHVLNLTIKNSDMAHGSIESITTAVLDSWFRCNLPFIYIQVPDAAMLFFFWIDKSSPHKLIWVFKGVGQ